MKNKYNRVGVICWKDGGCFGFGTRTGSCSWLGVGFPTLSDRLLHDGGGNCTGRGRAEGYGSGAGHQEGNSFATGYSEERSLK